MKKFLTVLLCLGVISPLFAQKARVDQALKLSGKYEKLGEARGLINQAMEDPSTQNDARTYFVAGKLEFDAFDNGFKMKMIKPDDPSAQAAVMGEELINGYNFFKKALPLDSVPNAKGKVEPKNSKAIINMLKGHANDYFQAGADFFNEKLYYPQAYEAFMIYGNLPSMVGEIAGVDDAQIATAFFNAGLAAYQGNQLEASAEAFHKAQLAGSDQPEAYIYEIACWQTIAQQDENKAALAQQKIMDAAQGGYEKFGIENPIFVNNMINSLVSEEKNQEALNKLQSLIAENPNNANLYGLRAFVYDRMENDDLSEADYRKAASLDNVDFETLKNASKKLYRIGAQKLNDVEGSSPEAATARNNIKNNYFLEAQKYAQKAAQMNPGDPDIQNVLDSLDYAITTYFGN